MEVICGHYLSSFNEVVSFAPVSMKNWPKMKLGQIELSSNIDKLDDKAWRPWGIPTQECVYIH